MCQTSTTTTTIFLGCGHQTTTTTYHRNRPCAPVAAGRQPPCAQFSVRRVARRAAMNIGTRTRRVTRRCPACLAGLARLPARGANKSRARARGALVRPGLLVDLSAAFGAMMAAPGVFSGGVGGASRGSRGERVEEEEEQEDEDEEMEVEVDVEMEMDEEEEGEEEECEEEEVEQEEEVEEGDEEEKGEEEEK